MKNPRVLLVFLLSSLASGWVLRSHKTEARDPTVKPKYPIILVPGDGGSQLLAKLNKTESPHVWCYKHTDYYYLLWLNLDVLYGRSLDCFIDNMKLHYNITDRKTYNTPGVDVVVPDFGGTSAIENLSDWTYWFSSYTRYYYKMVVALVNTFNYVRGETLFGAPYDFRKAPNEMHKFFANLTRLTEQAYYRNNNTRVVVIAHSYGCALTLHWLHTQTDAWKLKFIEKLVSASGPYGGTALTYEVYSEGYNLDVWLLNGPRLREEQRTSPSLAFLSPNPLLWPKDYVFVQTPEKNYTLTNTQDFFTDINYTVGWEMRKDTMNLLDISKPPGVEMFCLVGNGTATTERLIYNKQKTFPDKADTVVKGDGDGTVNLPSLSWCRRWAGRQKQPLTFRMYQGEDHMSVIQSDAVIADILAFVNGTLEDTPSRSRKPGRRRS